MAKVIAICGKICSGKTWYARQLREQEQAVILSCDEVTKALFNNDLGEGHDAMTEKIRSYLMNKSLELVAAGCTVILDWGFWGREYRQSFTDFFQTRGVALEWHYVAVTEELWQQNIRERNQRILEGLGGSDYFLDEGLMKKLQSKWEEPTPLEIPIRYVPVRE